MIKRCLYSVLLVVMLLMASCKERKVIPDETLVDIFHDAFLVNAYIGEEHINIDSLQIYEPIFQRYGYTVEDVKNAIGNFSRRKNVKLSSLMTQVIERLDKERKMYKKQVVILDTIKNVALRTFNREIYYDSLIVAKKRADSTNLHIVISPAPRGEYRITYSYICEDDLDKNPRSAEFYFTDENGYPRNRTIVTLRKSRKTQENGDMVNRTLVAREEFRSLVLNLGKYTDLDKGATTSGGKKGKKRLPPKTQSLKIKNLKVYHKLDQEDSIDSLFARYVDVKIFVDDFLIDRDSLAILPDTIGVATPIEPIAEEKSLDNELLNKKDSLALSSDSTRVSAPTTPNN